MTIEEITTINNRVQVVNTCTGDFNMLNDFLHMKMKSLDRSRLSYLYKVQYNGKTSYRFSLTETEHKQAVKFIPELNSL